MKRNCERATDRRHCEDWCVGAGRVSLRIDVDRGTVLNFKREEAARFSFLLGLPAIALAGLKELWVLFDAHIPSDAWSLLIFGLIVASVSAFGAIGG
ncbi:undecaprenyl-diphosphate phosphatase [Caballeronia catudaia]|uniref:undecaprenyl-diphosphate phosphatase n=1 Tax=Caballeronia catudaia TaxID=1777136 RepID=UPI000A8E2E08|nr:undecaprenyl-diphosphate phosphatase [Caballeronia catudaia]